MVDQNFDQEENCKRAISVTDQENTAGGVFRKAKRWKCFAAPSSDCRKLGFAAAGQAATHEVGALIILDFIAQPLSAGGAT